MNNAVFNIIDSSAWLSYFAGDENAEFFADPIETIDWLLVPSICLTEVFKTVFRQRGEDPATAAIAHMKEAGGGAIVNTASVHSLVSFATCTAYDAAKAGLLGLTRTLALDYGPDIRVNAVLPGAILTPLWDNLEVPQKERKRYADLVPAKRLGSGRDIANAVLYLSSDEASFVTGTSLVVDGGLLCRTD